MRERLALLALLALGGCAQGVASAQTVPRQCETIAYGGYTGDARCAALAARPILGGDRVCSTDDDCVVLRNSAACEGRAVASAHAARYAALPSSCTPPTAGPCSPVAAHCSSGCCTTMQTR